MALRATTSTWRFRETQHIATGAMVSASVWGDQDFLDLGITIKADRRGFKADLDLSLSAQEARHLAANLLNAAAEIERVA